MKGKITLIAFLAFTALQLNGQQIMTEQRTLLVKKTATWCPFCGSWGWTMMKGIMDAHEDEAIIVGMHYSGDLQSPAAQDLSGILTASGQPVFFGNNTNLRVNSGNVNSKLQEVNTLVNTGLGTTARIGVGLEVKEDGSGDLTINFKAEFQEEVTGTFQAALLILENNVQNTQSGRSGMQDHPNVLREALNGVEGEEIASGTTPKSTVIDRSWTYKPNPNYNKSNLRFAVVIWENNGGNLVFENGLLQDEIEISTQSNTLSNRADISITPSILTDEVSVNIIANRPENVRVQMFDLLGHEVGRLYDGQVPAGKTALRIQRGDVPRAGMYLVTLSAGKDKITKRLLVK